MWYHRRKDKWKDKCRETTGTRGIMAHGSIHVLSTVPEGEEKREMEKNAWRKQLAQIWCKYKQIWVQTQIRINTKENKHTDPNTYHSHIANLEVLTAHKVIFLKMN